MEKIEIIANKILQDYDLKNPGTIFKEKKIISNEEALLIQSNVARLRQKRGEEIIGIKSVVFPRIHKRKWGLPNLLVVTSGKMNCTIVE